LTDTLRVGRVGIWSSELRMGDQAEVADAVAELDELGYGAIWLPGRSPEDLEERVTGLLEASRAVTVATGIVSIWTHGAAETAALHARVTEAHPGRFLLGIGVSHEPLVARTGQTYDKPLSGMQAYLDELDSAGRPVPPSQRILAALAPKMLGLARARSRGSHPYLVTPEHTQYAREILGADALLAPEQMVVLETDPKLARAVARQKLELYLGLPNYVANLKRHGFADADVEHGGSDRLVDEIIAWGTRDAIAARVEEHLAAGADHVCIQVLPVDHHGVPRAEWRLLAPALRVGQ
jgi:probable F420-dependent oxidoreductase